MVSSKYLGGIVSTDIKQHKELCESPFCQVEALDVVLQETTKARLLLQLVPVGASVCPSTFLFLDSNLIMLLLINLKFDTT